jgi:cob(I)alamin adenosyltransferase
MASRLTRIYTRQGDHGSTAFSGGEKIAKDDPAIEALGTVDELNCAIGLALSSLEPEAEATIKTESVGSLLIRVQHELFEVGGDLYRGVAHLAIDDCVAVMEGEIDRLNEQLGPLEEFILPGGCRAAAECHLARALCRRAERAVVAMVHAGHPDSGATRYLNRLSDLLFVVARTINHTAGHKESCWQPRRATSDN